jgi:flagellar assembly factor FliW
MNSSAAYLMAQEPDLTVASDLLGPLSVSAEEIIDFPAGLFGFPECRRFVIVPGERDGFFWLQSADHSALAFLLVDPFLFFEGYSVDLSDQEIRELGASDASEVAILSIVTLPRSRQEQPTANLQGPLAIGFGQRRAMQLAIAESEFGVRCRFDPVQPAGAS